MLTSVALSYVSMLENVDVYIFFLFLQLYLKRFYNIKYSYLIKISCALMYEFKYAYQISVSIIMSRDQLGYSWPSLATSPYRPLLSADPQGYIPYRHRASVCRFELDVQPLLVHVQGSTGIHHSRARPYFSSSFPSVWFV